MKATVVQPYLFLGGRCEEALKFYQTALGAKLGMMMRFSENPQPDSAGSEKLPPGFENKIMHASFSIGDSMIFASDGNEVNNPFKGFSLCITVSAQPDADRYFEALAEKGNVVMPLTKMFYSPRFGMVTDKFGILWMIMVSDKSQGK